MTAIENSAAKLDIQPKSVRRRLRKLGYSRQHYPTLTPSKIIQIIKKGIAA